MCAQYALAFAKKEQENCLRFPLMFLPCIASLYHIAAIIGNARIVADCIFRTTTQSKQGTRRRYSNACMRQSAKKERKGNALNC